MTEEHLQYARNIDIPLTDTGKRPMIPMDVQRQRMQRASSIITTIVTSPDPFVVHKTTEAVQHDEQKDLSARISVHVNGLFVAQNAFKRMG